MLACRAGKKDWNKLSLAHSRVVNLSVNQAPFERRTKSHTRFLFAIKPATVGLGTDDQHDVGTIDLANHPPRKAFGRSLLELIDPAVNVVRPQPLREFKYTLRMHIRVVAVADKCGRHPLRTLRDLADRIQRCHLARREVMLTV